MRLTSRGRAWARLLGMTATALLLSLGLWWILGSAPPLQAPSLPTPAALPATVAPPPPQPAVAAPTATQPPAPAATPPPQAALPVAPTPPPTLPPSPAPPAPTLPLVAPPTVAAPSVPATPTVHPPLPAAPTPGVARAPAPAPAPGTRPKPPRTVSTPTPPHVVTVYAPGIRFGDPRPPDPRRIVHISSPAVHLNADVVEVYVINGAWQVADYAAGHHWGTANPGDGGNIVITGHNNWRGEVFRYLEFMQPGNEIDVTTADGALRKYFVREMQKLPEKNVSLSTQLVHAEVMAPTPYEQLTLITCWPYTTYTHRLVIFARP